MISSSAGPHIGTGEYFTKIRGPVYMISMMKSSNNVSNREDRVSGFKIKPFKPLNPLTLMVKLFQHYPMIHMGYVNKSTYRRKLVENCTFSYA